MKTKGIIFFHLIIWLLLAVGCGPKKINNRATTNGVQAGSVPISVGMAFDSLKNQFLADQSCLRIPEDRVNEATGKIISAKILKIPTVGELTARMNVNSSQLAEDTLWGLGARVDGGKTDSVKVAAAVGQFAKVSNNRFTSNVVYSLKLSGGIEAIDPQARVTLALLPDDWGTGPEKVKARRDQCGDSFLSSKELGASLEAVLTFEFENEESKKSFDAAASLEIPGSFGVGGGAHKYMESASRKANISINITQQGGDPSRLAEVFGGVKRKYKELRYGSDMPSGLNISGVSKPAGPNDKNIAELVKASEEKTGVSETGFHDVTNCLRSQADACFAVMDTFIDYAAGFGEQFKGEKGENLGLYVEGNYKFKPYIMVDKRFGDLRLEDGARQLLDSYRSIIASQFVDEYALFLRSQSILNRLTALDSSRVLEIKDSQGVFLKRMEVITHAIRVCYGLDVDPESIEGYDFIVTRCGSMVNKLNAFLYDKGEMNTVITCKEKDPGIPIGEDPLAQGQAKNWYYPMIHGYGGLIRRACFKIAKPDIKFDPTVLAIHSFSIREWLQKYDMWYELLVKSKISKDEDSKARFKALARNLLSEAEVFSLYRMIINDFKDRSGNKIEIKYDEFDVFDSMDYTAVDQASDVWKTRKWVIPTTTILNMETLGCKTLKFDKGAGVQSFIQNLDPVSSLKSLEALDLSQNRVSDLTALRYLSKLWILYLDGNPIKRLSSLGRTRGQIKVLSLRNLPNLKEDGSLESPDLFDPDNKNMNKVETVIKLQDELGSFKNLEKIDLSENSVWPVHEIVNGGGGFPKLREIYLVNLNAKTNLEKNKWAENIKALLNSIIDHRKELFPELAMIHISIAGVSQGKFAPDEIIERLDNLNIDQDFSNPPGPNFLNTEPCIK